MRATALFGIALLTGCVTPVPDDPRSNPEAMEPLVCVNKNQCDAWWQRAQAWVAQNSSFKVQTASDAIIQTYGPSPNQTFSLAFTITRTPNPDGSARITIATNCSNTIRCMPTRTEAIVSFKRFVRT